jgi:hypothetical protein
MEFSVGKRFPLPSGLDFLSENGVRYPADEVFRLETPSAIQRAKFSTQRITGAV